MPKIITPQEIGRIVRERNNRRYSSIKQRLNENRVCFEFAPLIPGDEADPIEAILTKFLDELVRGVDQPYSLGSQSNKEMALSRIKAILDTIMCLQLMSSKLVGLITTLPKVKILDPIGEEIFILNPNDLSEENPSKFLENRDNLLDELVRVKSLLLATDSILDYTIKFDLISHMNNRLSVKIKPVMNLLFPQVVNHQCDNGTKMMVLYPFLLDGICLVASSVIAFMNFPKLIYPERLISTIPSIDLKTLKEDGMLDFYNSLSAEDLMYLTMAIGKQIIELPRIIENYFSSPLVQLFKNRDGDRGRYEMIVSDRQWSASDVSEEQKTLASRLGLAAELYCLLAPWSIIGLPRFSIYEIAPPLYEFARETTPLGDLPSLPYDYWEPLAEYIRTQQAEAYREFR